MTPSQCRAARALLGWSRAKLAAVANLDISTVGDFERQRRVSQQVTVNLVRRALEEAGIEFAGDDERGVHLSSRQGAVTTP